MTPRTFALIIGAALIAVSFVMLSTAVNATTPNGGTVACGTGWTPDTSKAAHDSSVNTLTNAFLADAGNYSLMGADKLAGFEQACASAITSRRTWGYVLIGLGAVVSLGALVIRRTPATPAAPAGS